MTASSMSDLFYVKVNFKARVGNVGESSKSKLDFESIWKYLFISFGPDEMIGRAYYSPTTATDSGFFSFFVRAFDLLITVRL